MTSGSGILRAYLKATWIFSRGDHEKIMCHVEFPGPRRRVILVLGLKISEEGETILWRFWSESFCLEFPGAK